MSSSVVWDLPRHVLSERLKRLVEHGILTKVPICRTSGTFEYQLTDKGLDLYPLILTMVQWADKWMDMGLGKPIEFTHKTCGHKFNSKVVCSEM